MKAIIEVLQKYEIKWDQLEEQANRAEAFSDKESLKISRAQQGMISMCAVLLMNKIKAELDSDNSSFIRSFTDKIKTQTNIREHHG